MDSKVRSFSNEEGKGEPPGTRSTKHSVVCVAWECELESSGGSGGPWVPREDITGLKKGLRRLVEAGSERAVSLPPWALFLHP